MADKLTLQQQGERYFARMAELAERDPQIKAALPIKAVQDAMLTPGASNAAIIATVMEGYAERPALGERCYDVALDAETGRLARRLLPTFETITYRELRARIEALACAWQHHHQHRVGIDDFVCILGATGIDFAVIDMATTYAQVVTVPLQTTLAGTEIEGILRDTAPTSLFASMSDLALATQLAITHGAINSLVAFDYDPRVDAEREIFELAQAEIKRAGAAITLTTIDALIEFGRAYQWSPLAPHPKGLDRMAGLLHSSGSTGTPKGVIIPERAMNLGWYGLGGPQTPMVAVVFAPMNHFMGRFQVYTPLGCGGTAYYTARTDMTTLFEDIRLCRPTFLSFFPRVFELIYQYYQSEVGRRVSRGLDTAAADVAVRAEMHDSYLGNRLHAGSIGSAPTAPEVIDFIRDTFDILLIEGYGSTEGGIMSTQSGYIARHIVIDYKLADVPELGYFSSDKPYPRGEFLVKSRLQTSGYFKRTEATAALIDAEGFIHTGDIMEERGPDHVVYIDRRNDVLKLSQAEFVAVGPLGTVFESGSAVIKQIYIYGNSSRAYLLAVVVPDWEAVEAKIGKSPDEAKLKALIRSEILDAAQAAKLRTFEIPRDFIIDFEPFSLENGLLSSVRKRMRPNLKRKYGERLEAMYVEIERKRQQELAALKDPKSPLTVLQKVVKALEASLGVEGIDPGTTKTFEEMGGDSLGTVSFSMFLEDIFGIEIPVNAIISPAGNPRRWAQLIETTLNSGSTSAPTFAKIHGKGARALHARDLKIERFLDPQSKAATEAPTAETRTVLLTGANGFLGHILCLGWMERLAQVNGKVICLIRAGNDAAARKRLDGVFSGVDKELEKHYRALAAKHLEVIAGDVAEPSLGLTPQTWERIANEVDHIVHPGALVNHVLSYEHMFGPNVFGTAELIRLALTKRQKRFDFVSSMAAAYRVDTGKRNDEDSPLLESLSLGDGYADGYGATKWADEVLLHDAHQRFGLPVNVFRGDMMMPHTRYKGQINVPDMFTRLLFSVVTTGLAPESFYEPGPDGKRARAHYDGLPVDFIAGAMIGIGAQAHRDIRTYNVVNHHADDGVSLDSVIDWIQSAGYAVDRISDHAQWFKSFEARLTALTEAQRQQSSIAILGMFRRRYPAHEAPIGSEHFAAAVRELPPELQTGPDVPHLTEAYIHKYLDDMRLLGLIGEARRAVDAVAVAA